jgi:polysaccharide biosynthesis transport protein
VEPDPSIGRAPQLGDYAAVLKARKWLVISVTLLALVGAGTYLALRTPLYSSTAEVQIFVTDEGLGTAVDLETEVRIAGSLSVADVALRSLADDFGSAEELLDHVSVALETEAAILTITFTHTSRDLAGRGAAAMQDAYLTFKGEQFTKRVQTEIASLEEKKRALDGAFTLQQTIKNDPSSSEADIAAANTELSGILLDLNEVRTRLAELANDQPAAGMKLGPPTIPTFASPGLPVVLGGAGVLGLFLGSILAFVVEGLTGRVREAEEVEQELGAAVLGMVPIMHLKRTRGRVPVVSRDTPSEPAAEAYRLLRSGFLYAAGSDERVVMVTSPGVGDGKSTTAANLAVALAQAGHKTVLVGGDLRRSDLHTLFGVPNDTGLVHVLEGRSRPAPLPTDVENLRIVPSGPPTDISAHLFETEAFPEALAILREQAEYVVVDAPPLAISDPLLMVPAVDYVVFVVDANKATRRALRRTRELLQRIGLPRMGVVLNRSKSPWGPSGSRAYYYYKKGKSADVPAAAPKEQTAAATKPVEPKPVPVEKPAASKPVESRPVTYEAPAESKPAAEAPAESKPVESKPVEPKPVEPKPVETVKAAAAVAPAEPAAAEQPTEAKPVEAKPGESKPVESKPAASDKPVASKPPEPVAAESPATAASKATTAEKPAESKPAESQPSAGAEKPAESKPVEVRALAAMPKPAASGPGAEETSKSKPESTPDAKAEPTAATPQTPAETAAAPDAAAVTSPVPGSPVTPAPVTPPAQQAPVEPGVKADPAAASAQPSTPEKAAESATGTAGAGRGDAGPAGGRNASSGACYSSPGSGVVGRGAAVGRAAFGRASTRAGNRIDAAAGGRALVAKRWPGVETVWLAQAPVGKPGTLPAVRRLTSYASAITAYLWRCAREPVKAPSERRFAASTSRRRVVRTPRHPACSTASSNGSSEVSRASGSRATTSSGYGW